MCAPMQKRLSKNSFLWSWVVISASGEWNGPQKGKKLSRKEKVLKARVISKLCSTENMVS